MLQEDIFIGMALLIIKKMGNQNLKKVKVPIICNYAIIHQEIVLFQCSWTLSVERYPRDQNTWIISIGAVEPLTEHDLVIGLDHSDNSPF